ncbi:hypothetical protein ACGCUQ_07775 [Eubacteriales bacterium KG127]
MKHIREFIYDKSDILVALAIIAIAAGLIFWRLEAISAYPKTLVNSEEIKSAQKEAKEKDKKEQKNSDKAKDSKSSEKESDKADAEKASSSGIYDGGVTGKDSTVTVASGSLTNAVQSLVSAGYFDSYNDYESACQGAGIDPSKIKTGTFTIPAGSTKADIATIVCQ